MLTLQFCKFRSNQAPIKMRMTKKLSGAWALFVSGNVDLLPEFKCSFMEMYMSPQPSDRQFLKSYD